MTKYVLREFIIMIWPSARDFLYLSHRYKYQSELPRPILWNQTSDVHRHVTLASQKPCKHNDKCDCRKNKRL